MEIQTLGIIAILYFSPKVFIICSLVIGSTGKSIYSGNLAVKGILLLKPNDDFVFVTNPDRIFFRDGFNGVDVGVGHGVGLMEKTEAAGKTGIGKRLVLEC